MDNAVCPRCGGGGGDSGTLDRVEISIRVLKDERKGKE